MKIVCYSPLGLQKLVPILEERGYDLKGSYRPEVSTIWDVKEVCVNKKAKTFTVTDVSFRSIPAKALRAGDIIFKYNNLKNKENATENH